MDGDQCRGAPMTRHMCLSGNSQAQMTGLHQEESNKLCDDCKLNTLTSWKQARLAAGLRGQGEGTTAVTMPSSAPDQ